METAAASVKNVTRAPYTMTEKRLAALRAEPGRRYEDQDSVVPQLRLRVSPTSKSWSVIYRVAGAGEDGRTKGPMRRMTLGDYPRVTIARARELAREALEVAERGADPASQQRAAVAQRNEREFQAVAARFVEEYARQQQMEWRSTKSYLDRYVAPRWRGRLVDELRRGDVSALLAAVRIEAIIALRERAKAAGRTRIDARHDLAGTSAAREVRKHLRKLFNWALMQDLVEFNPAAGVRKELRYERRERVLSLPELRRVWDAAGEMGFPFGDVTRLLILTGQRRSEVAEARWAWLDRDNALIEVPAASYKTKRLHAYPLSAPALAIVDRLGAFQSDFLFPIARGPQRGDTPVSGFSKAKPRLHAIIQRQGEERGLPPMQPFTLHDLRRSVATGLAGLGVPGDYIERVLGHVLGGVKEVYDRHSYLEEKRAALQAWGRLWS